MQKTEKWTFWVFGSFPCFGTLGPDPFDRTDTKNSTFWLNQKILGFFGSKRNSYDTARTDFFTQIDRTFRVFGGFLHFFVCTCRKTTYLIYLSQKIGTTIDFLVFLDDFRKRIYDLFWHWTKYFSTKNENIFVNLILFLKALVKTLWDFNRTSQKLKLTDPSVWSFWKKNATTSVFFFPKQITRTFFCANFCSRTFAPSNRTLWKSKMRENHHFRLRKSILIDQNRSESIFKK